MAGETNIQESGRRKRAYSYDPLCLDVARYFLPRATEDRLQELAQDIQDAIELSTQGET
jgi:hypothetical protein